MMDEVWLVYVNESTQIERLMNRNGFTKKDALARIKSQMRLDDKRTYADVIIDNNGTPINNSNKWYNKPIKLSMILV